MGYQFQINFFIVVLCKFYIGARADPLPNNDLYTQNLERMIKLDEDLNHIPNRLLSNPLEIKSHGLEYMRRSLQIRVAMRDESDTSLQKGDSAPISYQVIARPILIGHNLTLTFQVDNHIVSLHNVDAKNQVHLRINRSVSYFTIFVKALNVGKTNIQINAIQVPSKSFKGSEILEENKFDGNMLYDVNNSTITVSVYKSKDVQILSEAFGWIYFVSWGIIFYPQIYGNWRTKSVVGVNFDFLAIVLVDLSLYTVYMMGLFCSHSIQREYKSKHDTEVIPVKINDVVFGVIVVCATLVVIAQCKIYKSGGQKVSNTCKMILGGIFVFLVVVAVITLFTNTLQWIDFLTYISFVKIFTVTKYVPQIYMNFKRQSTSGFSVGVVICDFSGGMFSMLQMIVDSYNFEDWSSFSGNPTKFIVGLFTLVFDVIMIMQHYFCYRDAPHWEEIPSGDENDENCNSKSISNI